MPRRNWLITGVSNGFDRIMTEQLLARGDRIAGTVRDLSVMDDLKVEYGDRMWLAELDPSQIASIRGVVDRA
jgi:NAD(P)-dependent dehydrogenase (short-subunit alcohol dehydrogenase family)